MMVKSLLLAVVVLLGASCAAPGHAAGGKPDETPPSYLYFAKEAKSPLITSAFPLHRAVAYWDLPGVKAAVEQGKADVNQRAEQPNRTPGKPGVSFTPLQVAFESTAKCGASCQDFSEPLQAIIAYLLCAGANPNQKASYYPGASSDSDRQPLLTKAAYTGTFEVVYALLQAGADPNSALGKKTALEVAAGCDYRDSSDTGAMLSSALLLAYGADAKTKSFSTVCADCPMTYALLKAGVTPAEASELKAGRLPPSLLKKVNMQPSNFDAAARLARAAAGAKACPAKQSAAARG